MAPKAGVLTRPMFYTWVEDILGDWIYPDWIPVPSMCSAMFGVVTNCVLCPGDCEDFDFKDSIDALIDAATHEVLTAHGFVAYCSTCLPPRRAVQVMVTNLITRP